jgi:uncharacterized protein (TIGR00255 family)
MKSMTGYAAAELRDGDTHYSVEIKGYNSRYLEVAASLPPNLGALEGRLREAVQALCNRGKVEIALHIRGAAGSFGLSVNTDAARAYAEAAKKLGQIVGSDEALSVTELMRMEGVLETDKPSLDEDALWTRVEPLLESALEKFERERTREGEHTERDIFAHLTGLVQDAELIAKLAPAEELVIKENVRKRLTEIAGDIQFDENRLLTEAALLVMKYTISEELSRLSAHFAAFAAEVKNSNSPRATPGKKLDFLCQEINREVNTIGSKSQSTEISRTVVAMKEKIENIREQLRNVE